MITYKVKLAGRKRCETVKAEYFRIEGGVLSFRNSCHNTYPTFVKCFAAGSWFSVENTNVDAETGGKPDGESN